MKGFVYTLNIGEHKEFGMRNCTQYQQSKCSDKQWCEQDQSNKTKTAAYKTKTTGTKQRHFADLTFK